MAVLRHFFNEIHACIIIQYSIIICTNGPFRLMCGNYCQFLLKNWVELGKFSTFIA
jgi:hypothetical protein